MLYLVGKKKSQEKHYWLSCILLGKSVCINLHVAWGGDPKAVWQVSCSWDEPFHFITHLLEEQRLADICIQCSSFGWIVNGYQKQLSETLTEELQEEGIAAVFISDLCVLWWWPKTVAQKCCSAWNDKEIYLRAQKGNEWVFIPNEAVRWNGPVGDESSPIATSSLADRIINAWPEVL